MSKPSLMKPSATDAQAFPMGCSAGENLPAAAFHERSAGAPSSRPLIVTTAIANELEKRQPQIEMPLGSGLID